MTAETTPAGALPPLPGDCLPIPGVRAEIRDVHGRIAWTVETHVVPGLDLDGRGSPVVLVPPDRRNLNQFAMWWRLFIQRGRCGHELGIVVGTEDPMPAPGESHGLRNFTVAESVAPDVGGGLQGVGTTTYVFNGERYVGGRTEYR